MAQLATSENCMAITRLACQLWPEANEADLLKEFKAAVKSNDEVVFISLHLQQVIGFVHASLRHEYVEGTSSSPVGYIEAIYVLPSHRKRGTGSALLHAAEKWAAQKGCSEMASDTEFTNTLSEQFHQRNGFTEANRIVHFIKPINKS